MLPTIWDEKKSEHQPKPVSLRLATEEVEGKVGTALLAVNEDGDEVAILLAFGANKVYAIDQAKESLENEGYDTSFSAWNDDGAMVLFHS